MDGAGGAEEITYVEGDQRRKPVGKDLNILQWNADAILSSREELREYTKRGNVDIWCIQETKQIEKDKTPHVGIGLYSHQERRNAGEGKRE